MATDWKSHYGNFHMSGKRTSVRGAFDIRESGPLAAMLEPWEDHPPSIKVCCGKCGRAFGVADLIGGFVFVEGTSAGNGRAQFSAVKSRPSLRYSTGWMPLTRDDPALSQHQAFVCHKKCGARYEVRHDTLTYKWLRAAQAGASKMYLGDRR